MPLIIPGTMTLSEQRAEEYNIPEEIFRLPCGIKPLE